MYMFVTSNAFETRSKNACVYGTYVCDDHCEPGPITLHTAGFRPQESGMK